VTPAEENPADESVITQIQPALLEVAPRVLVVDDDEIMVERLRDLVTAAGFEVSSAANGADALDSLRRDFAPIVILDRNMPGMDGITLCKAIRASQYPGYVYIMLVTAHDSEEEILAGLDAGADDYLSKRVSGTQVIARLATARRILTLEHSLKQVIEERRRMAMSDALTGAHNRRYFMNHMRRELKRARRFGSEVSLLVFDIDHFKHINDTYGHLAGDAVLRQLGALIKNRVRRDDVPARTGGEEFAVILPEVGVEGAVQLAEKLRMAVESSTFKFEGTQIPVTISIGVAEWTPEVVDPQELVKATDEKLYEAKRTGRNRTCS
jgi:two-component system cell cycle response regulator